MHGLKTVFLRSCLLLAVSEFLRVVESLTKVVVPAVYKEWRVSGPPDWAINRTLQEQLGYSVYLYQRLDPAKPNFVKNRGTEGGVFLRYIVDHYDSFPDIAIFVHARPEEHQKHWLDMIPCIHPNATYININIGQDICRTTHNWKDIEIWVEQCFRDVLRVTWELDRPDNLTQFLKLVPPSKELQFCFVCCQQFLLSRDTMRRRPLAVWKKLYQIVAEQDACHEGEPDYSNLFSFQQSQQRVGPEPADIEVYGEGVQHNIKGWGRHTQGSAMEHLSQVVFGHLHYDMEFPDHKEMCRNFLPHCPHSPCN